MENARKVVKLLVDPETGEIQDEVYEGDRLRLTRKEQIEYIDNNKEEIERDKIYKFGQDNKFSMLSEFSARQLANEKLTASEYRVLLLMISNTNYKSGVIALGNNHDITIGWITKELNITKKTTESCVDTLVNKGIIARNTTNNKTKYFFNPYIQYKGRWINKTLYEMFRNTRWAKNDSK